MGEARATLRAAWPHHEQEGCLASEEAEATQCSAALLQQLVAAATWTTRELEAKTALLVVPAPAPAARPGLPKEAPSSSLVDGKKRRRQQQPPPSAVAAEEAPLPLVLRPNRAAAVAGEEREGWREDIEASTRHHRMLAVARAALPRARGHSGGAAGGASMNSGGLLSRKRVRGEQPAAGPWPAEAWLGGLAELTLLASDFDQHVWPWLLTHPAATRSDSLRLALACGEEDDEARANPLLLNVFAVLALAAQFRGEPKRAEEYYQRARAHLGALFDVHAIEVAEGLRALGHYSLALADFARYSYYYSLALSICRSLRAYSSDVFVRTLYGGLMDPSIPQSEKLVLMQELTAKVDLREYRMEEDRLALATEKYRHIVTSPEEGGHTSARHPPHHLPALLREWRSVSHLVSSCLLLLNLYKETASTTLWTEMEGLPLHTIGHIDREAEASSSGAPEPAPAPERTRDQSGARRGGRRRRKLPPRQQAAIVAHPLAHAGLEPDKPPDDTTLCSTYNLMPHQHHEHQHQHQHHHEHQHQHQHQQKKRAVVRDQCAVRFFGQALALYEEKLAIDFGLGPSLRLCMVLAYCSLKAEIALFCGDLELAFTTALQFLTEIKGNRSHLQYLPHCMFMSTGAIMDVFLSCKRIDLIKAMLTEVGVWMRAYPMSAFIYAHYAATAGVVVVGPS